MRPPLFKLAWLTLAMLLVSAAPAQASLIVTAFAGDTHEADGYSTFNSTSASMIGMRVDVFWANGSSDSALWTASGIARTQWTMTQGPGSTFSNPFVLTNNSNRRMTRFVMHGAGSSTIFDRSTAASTTGTANGRDLQEYTFLRFDQDITVTYFDEVQTVGASAVGDIYAGMDVDFDRGVERRGGQFIFRTDTDNTVNFVRLAVPEPTSAMHFGMLGLLCCGFRRRAG